jgi:dTMP kinase
MLIMIDGIDGSGKSTVVQAFKEYLANEGNAIFDLKNYWKEQGRYPELSEIKSYDFIFSCEPTRVGIGQVIRDELIKQGNNYPTRAIAEAFSLDRLVLYNKIIIPLLLTEKTIIQDRGISTSLAYQPSKTLSLKNIKNLVGNKLALKYRPDHLILLDIDPKLALQRLDNRNKKKDNAIFEQLNYQKKNAKKFKSKEFQNIFLKQKTCIHYLPTDENIDIMKVKVIKLFKYIIHNT